MQRTGILPLRVFVILTAAAFTAACFNGPLAAGNRADPAIAASVQYPVSSRELNPPPSPVEIRAQCWMRHERDAVDLDTKTALVKKCVADRTGITGQ